MKRALLAAVWLLGPVMAGCAHEYHEAKADYHHERANAEWDHGHPVGAAKQKIKEGREEVKAH